MDQRPIGVFDSGVGGLTAVKELHTLLPGEDIIYFGDIGRVPYGTRSAQTIQRYARQDLEFLNSFHVKAILAACGTVSANFSVDNYKDAGFQVPYITVVEPAAQVAVRCSTRGHIGIMATTASIKSHSYEQAILAQNPSAQITGVPCPLLIPMVENGLMSPTHPMVDAALNLYLAPLLQAQVDTIILGCTHFPLLEPAIRQKVGKDVILIDSGAQAAQEMKSRLTSLGLLNGAHQGKTTYYVSDTVELFAEVAGNFLQEDVRPNSHSVDIEDIDRNL